MIEFEGSVQAERGSGVIGLSLRGAAHRSVLLGACGRPRAPAALELLFSGVTQVAPALPATLHGVRVVDLDPECSAGPERSGTARAPHLFRLDAREGRYTIRAHGLQLHAQTGDAFFAALPRVRVAALQRWGWRVLLSLLRLPPIARLLGRTRH